MHNIDVAYVHDAFECNMAWSQTSTLQQQTKSKADGHWYLVRNLPIIYN